VQSQYLTLPCLVEQLKCESFEKELQKLGFEPVRQPPGKFFLPEPFVLGGKANPTALVCQVFCAKCQNDLTFFCLGL
jgi:hypothetical protein